MPSAEARRLPVHNRRVSCRTLTSPNIFLSVYCVSKYELPSCGSSKTYSRVLLLMIPHQLTHVGDVGHRCSVHRSGSICGKHCETVKGSIRVKMDCDPFAGRSVSTSMKLLCSLPTEPGFPTLRPVEPGLLVEEASRVPIRLRLSPGSLSAFYRASE